MTTPSYIQHFHFLPSLRPVYLFFLLFSLLPDRRKKLVKQEAKNAFGTQRCQPLSTLSPFPVPGLFLPFSPPPLPVSIFFSLEVYSLHLLPQFLVSTVFVFNVPCSFYYPILFSLSLPTPNSGMYLFSQTICSRTLFPCSVICFLLSSFQPFVLYCSLSFIYYFSTLT